MAETPSIVLVSSFGEGQFVFLFWMLPAHLQSGTSWPSEYVTDQWWKTAIHYRPLKVKEKDNGVRYAPIAVSYSVLFFFIVFQEILIFRFRTIR